MNKSSHESPIVLAARLTPWWMNHIREFGGLEIWPCKTIDLSGSDTHVMCKATVSNHWTVYGIKTDDYGQASMRPFERFPTESEAQGFLRRLKETYPHLRDERPNLQSRPNDQPTP